MKLNPMNPLIQQQIFDAELEYFGHKRTKRAALIGDEWVMGPKPPTVEAVKKAQFVDKTYIWEKDAGIRPRN